MKIVEYEKAIISVILRFSFGPENIPQRICSELDSDKFGMGANRIIYHAIQNIVIRGEIPNIPNIAKELGASLETVGGEEYLQSLLGFLPLLGVSQSEGYETWVRAIDSAGRLRQLGLVVDSYGKLYEDFEGLLNQVSDVDIFISNFLDEVNRGIGQVRTTYVHISDAIEEERKNVELSREGFVTDIIPTGWPSLEKYFIPRPGTFGVIIGLSSIGKTQFALQLMLGVAINLYDNNLPGHVAFNSLEMSKTRLVRRMACCLAGVNSDNLSAGVLSDKVLDSYLEQLDYVGRLPILLDDNPDLTSPRFVSNALSQHISHGPRVLGILDYLELLRDKSDNEERKVTLAARNQRRVAWQTNSCEVALSQFNNTVLMTSDKIGGLHKARHSGGVGQAADWGIEIYNLVQMKLQGLKVVTPDGYNEDFAYGLIPKNKDHAIGRIQLEWIPEMTRFKDVALGMNELYRSNYEGDF